MVLQASVASKDIPAQPYAAFRRVLPWATVDDVLDFYEHHSSPGTMLGLRLLQVGEGNSLAEHSRQYTYQGIFSWPVQIKEEGFAIFKEENKFSALEYRMAQLYASVADQMVAKNMLLLCVTSSTPFGDYTGYDSLSLSPVSMSRRAD